MTESAKTFTPSAVVLILIVALGLYFIRDLAEHTLAHDDSLPGQTTLGLARSVAFEAPQGETPLAISGNMDDERAEKCKKCHPWPYTDEEDGDPDEWRTDFDDDEIPHKRVKDFRLEHDEKNRGCPDCHDRTDGNRSLHLANGTRVPYTQSYKLCGQCHGPTFRDWRLGIHGKRVGQWNGLRQYLLCVDCHDPHRPAIQNITPFPAPVPPGFDR